MGYGKISNKQKEILEYLKSQLLIRDIHHQFVKYVRQ